MAVLTFRPSPTLGLFVMKKTSSTHGNKFQHAEVLTWKLYGRHVGRNNVFHFSNSLFVTRRYLNGLLYFLSAVDNFCLLCNESYLDLRFSQEWLKRQQDIQSLFKFHLASGNTKGKYLHIYLYHFFMGIRYL